MLSQLLIQFVFRVTFGMTLAMAVTPSRQVTSGFYRVHLWVLMGLNTLAALVLFSQRAQFAETLARPWWLVALGALLATLCYIGAVIWLYEVTQWGQGLLYLISSLGILAAVMATPIRTDPGTTYRLLAMADLLTSGALLGLVLAAMLLGHWYLNTPTMQLMPLRRLILLIVVAVLARTLVSGTGLFFETSQSINLEVHAAVERNVQFWIFVASRWLSGILGTLVFAVMAWCVLKVPNTQSATGILYAGVVVVFLGELASQLLSVNSHFPL